jgi:hypothetical protein
MEIDTSVKLSVEVVDTFDIEFELDEICFKYQGGSHVCFIFIFRETISPAQSSRKAERIALG